LPVTFLLKLTQITQSEIHCSVHSSQRWDDFLQMHKWTVYFSVHFTDHLAVVWTTLYSVDRSTVFDITEAV